MIAPDLPTRLPARTLVDRAGDTFVAAERNIMQTFPFVASLFVFVASFVFQEGVVPVFEEPRHRVVFENQYVRVLDVVLPPGDATLFHRHAEDLIGVTIADAPTRRQEMGKAASDAPAGKAGDVWFQGYKKSPAIHKVTNTGTTSLHYVAAEILSSIGAPLGSPALGSGLKPVLENDRVRVSRLTLEPNQSI